MVTLRRTVCEPARFDSRPASRERSVNSRSVRVSSVAEPESIAAATVSGTANAGSLTFSSTAYEVRALTITLTPATTPAAGDKFRVKVVRDANLKIE